MSTAITDVRVFDGHALSKPTTLVLTDGLVSSGPVPDGADIVDGTGGTVLAGLIDTHVHVHDREHLEACAHWGVTTVLDMGAAHLDRTRALRDQPGLSSLLTAGRPASGPGSRFITEMGMPASTGVTGPHDAARFVAERVAEGSDYLKIIVEDGKFPGAKPLDATTVEALVREAREAGMTTVAHVVSPDTVRLAVRAGVDVITHAAVTSGLGEELERELAQRPVTIIPTLAMMDGVVRTIGRKPVLRVLSTVVPALRMSYRHAEDTVDLFRRSGSPVLVGTDANVDTDAPWSPPFGESLHDELERLVRAGLTPAEAIRGATLLAAEVFGLDDRGALSPGLRADVVLCDGDPTSDISRTREIRGVWIAGTRVR